MSHSSASRVQAHVVDPADFIALVHKAVAAIAKPPRVELLDHFIREYFRHVPAMDLASMVPEQAAHRMLAAWQFMQQRSVGQSQVQLFNPTLKQHGWHSHNTTLLAINDDMPFLVDSLTAEVNAQGFDVFSMLHPIVHVLRDAEGLLQMVASAEEAAKDPRYQPESLIDLEITQVGDQKDMARLKRDVEEVFVAVRFSVHDWPMMMARVEETLGALSQLPSAVARDEMPEALEFLAWVKNHHFVFLGVADFELVKDGKKSQLLPVDGSGFGLYNQQVVARFSPGISLKPYEAEHLTRRSEVVYITKTEVKSAVHRPVAMDMISVKKLNNRGEVVGERRMVGLFTSTVYFEPMHQIPLIRQKADHVIDRSGFAPKSHDGKALVTILEFLPRDEMFAMSEDDLFQMAMGVLSLESRPRVRLFTRKDEFERFISCLVYLPRLRFSTDMRTKVQQILEEAFHGVTEGFYTQLTDSPLARIHFKLRTVPGAIPTVDMDALNHRLAEAVSAWDEALARALANAYGPNHGAKMMRLYGKAFLADYVARYSVSDAVDDIRQIEMVAARKKLGVELREATGGILDLRLYSPGVQVALSDILPVLEHMGLKALEEVACKILPVGMEDGVWIHDFRLSLRQGEMPPLASVKGIFEESLLKIWHREVENDGFNRLVLAARLDWRDVVVMRAYAKYLKQARFFYGMEAVADSLSRYPALASLLSQFFHARFNPELGQHRDARLAAVRQELDEALSSVQGVTDDRILRRFLDLILATQRTNFYQTSEAGEPKPYLSFKFASQQVPFLPKPVPFAEIFVYATRVEGIHLRGGKVSRGGIRWSDRHEDFRTEILGLLKAQMVKNAVIVPEGAKGGFVVKEPPASGDRQEVLDEAIYCYITFLSGLLDVTDNIVDGRVVPPVRVVRHDGDDPYLVVAADKGTASFSDIANGVSESYGFWLGDAFASGGSVGYDHKKMGITAKGAWVSVQRHFREMGIDPERDVITAIGIGDMSGDVFGNGLLRSRTIQLVAAFNHMHVFVDPNPDTAKSFMERERMFQLPRSTWADYDEKLISKGGGVFLRSAKSISITPEMKERFAIEANQLTPDELIRAILKSPVDLLWNGGIGTYVKAQDENHADVGDRANEAVRVDGHELRCRVVGEGGNLGFTQRGRIEYALAGGRINTDAIDNSGGVDCSDHEVNIKIALRRAVEAKSLTLAKRDALLVDMTPEVEYLVLRDNVLQTQALTIAERQGIALLGAQARVMKMLEKEGMLDRAIEFLPNDDALEARKQQGKGLTRPELAVLLAYSKMHLFRDLLCSGLPDDGYFGQDLIRYFPMAMRDSFAQVIGQHPLKREIIATMTTNSIINRVGSTFFYQLTDDTGMESCDIARAYVVARDSFALRDFWAAIEELDGVVAVDVQAEMFSRINHLVYRLTLWLLRNLAHPLAVADAVARFSQPVKTLMAAMPSLLDDALKQQQRLYQEAAVPEALAESMALLPWMAGAYDMVRVSEQSGVDVKHTAKAYRDIGQALGLDRLYAAVNRLDAGDDWSRQAVSALESQLFDHHARLTLQALKASGKTPEEKISQWLNQERDPIARLRHTLDDFTTGSLDLARLMVALRKVEAVAREV